MAAKNNIRSIRFSDELAKLIDRQVGNTFTQKFENLITTCVWELPARKSELNQLEKQIAAKKKQLQEMTVQAGELQMTLSSLIRKTADLEAGILQALKKWDV